MESNLRYHREMSAQLETVLLVKFVYSISFQIIVCDMAKQIQALVT